MNKIFLLQNQDKLFLSKQNQWVDGRDLGCLYKTRHKDEALNQLFEVNTKDYSQRIHVLGCAIKANGFPEIDPADLPPPMEQSAGPVNGVTEAPAESAAGGDDSGNQSALAFSR